MAINYNFSQERQNILLYSDIFSSVKIAKETLTSDLTAGMAAMSKGGVVKLSNGQEFNMDSSAGAMGFQLYMDQLNAKSTFVDSTFDAIRGYEKSLQSNLGQ
jgi:hypothetical protein